MDQGSDEWVKARLGKVTASRIGDLMAKVKSGGYSATRANYLAEKILEKLTGMPQDTYVSQAMQQGMDLEPEARAAYSFLTGEKVLLEGFVRHPEIEESGASPDGLIIGGGLVQIKCPQPAAHLNVLLTGKVDQKYVYQMQWELACTQRKWCDFISYNPTMPPEMQLFRLRFQRDEALIQDIRSEVVAFLIDLRSRLEALRALYGVKEAA